MVTFVHTHLSNRTVRSQYRLTLTTSLVQMLALVQMLVRVRVLAAVRLELVYQQVGV
jgi:hypothetical protein